MNQLEQLAAEMELDEGARLRLAEELLRLRRLASGCRKYRRRLPTPVQCLLDAPVRIAEEPPPIAGSVPRLV